MIEIIHLIIKTFFANYSSIFGFVKLIFFAVTFDQKAAFIAIVIFFKFYSHINFQKRLDMLCLDQLYQEFPAN